METTLAPEQMKEADPYIAAFDRFEQERNEPAWLSSLRKGGMARFAEVGFPTTRDEDWRFTNVAPIAKLPFQPATEPGVTSVPLTQFNFMTLECTTLVFTDGHFSPKLSTVLPLPKGAQVTNLASALIEAEPLVQKHLGRHASVDANPFIAMNTAYFQDGAFVHVPAGQVVEKPVHLLFVSTSEE